MAAKLAIYYHDQFLVSGSKCPGSIEVYTRGLIRVSTLTELFAIHGLQPYGNCM